MPRESQDEKTCTKTTKPPIGENEAQKAEGKEEARGTKAGKETEGSTQEKGGGRKRSSGREIGKRKIRSVTRR